MSNQIIVLGFYDRANLGDEMFKSTIPKLFPNHDLSFVSLENIKPPCNYNGTYKAIIVGGGDIVNDYFQKKILLATNGFNGPIIALGIGIPYPSLIDKGYLDIYDHVFIREKTDVRLIQKRLGSQYAHYLPDMGFILEKPHFKLDMNKNIGVCLASPVITSNSHKDQIVLFLEFLLQRGYTITLLKFNSSNNKIENDGIINGYIYSELSRKYTNVINDECNYSVENMLSILSSMDYNICTRFHANIFSTVVGIPFLSIYSSRKVQLFIDDIKYHNYAYNIPRDGEYIDVYELINKFYRLTMNRDKICKKLAGIQQEYSNLLKTRQPEILATSLKKRPRPNIIPNIDSIDIIHDNIKQHLINNTNYVPGSSDACLSLDEATETAKLISLSITGAPGDKYTYGTIQNLMDKPWELKGMIDWIIKDQLQEEDDGGYRLNMTYFNQENMKGLHRSGWQFCVEYLKSLQSDTGVLFDLYMDRTFHWASSILEFNGTLPYTSPWIGFIHHGIDNEFSDYHLDGMMNNPLFIQSLPMCKGIFTLSSYLKEQIEIRLASIYPYYNLKVESLFHPTQFIPASNCFTIDKFIYNKDRMLINVGGWYRNMTTIYRLGMDKKGNNELSIKPKRCLPCLSRKSKIDGENNLYKIRKAILKGKNMDSYFPPEEFGIVGGYEIEEVYGTKLFFLKIVSSLDGIIEGSIISDDPLPKKNKWVYYMEKYINDNELLVNELSVSPDDIPYNFKFNINDNISEEDIYMCALQKYIKNMLDSVTVVEHLPDSEYDNLLSENIVFLDLVDCSAANVIIECIVRNTPLIINRHPAIEEYLGKDYPLFYDDISDVTKLLTIKNIRKGYYYLLYKNKDFLHIDYLLTSLKKSHIYQNLNK